MFPVTDLTKINYWDFEISNLIVANGKVKIANILEMANHRAKRSEIFAWR